MMNWQSWSEFFHMGGYGLYVWGSYGVTLTLLVIESAQAVRRRRHALAHIDRQVRS